ncbi:hypothetical protein N7510_004822 [Penicillium lagena]|uniref:uncharacterized protein n=1 Tax=Penicillium lagena TaxID=94218 RepID=UPI0025407D98|nr:uncharacterized protein N7510_004822 [Penicillium lagena]KAJ5620838.1 hypothetical protein N7510_004822 [Penicillium lagena]
MMHSASAILETAHAPPAPPKPNPKCKPKAKRAPSEIPTTTHYIDSQKFKILARTVPQHLEWHNGEGWAIEASKFFLYFQVSLAKHCLLTSNRLGWPPTGIAPIPEHYQLIAGYVTIETKEREEKDDCGNVQRIVKTVTRNYDSYSYDIRAQTINGVKKILFISRTTSAGAWEVENAKKHYGPIRQGLTYEIVRARGEQLANTMGNYHKLWNNCDTFAQRLYRDISG